MPDKSKSTFFCQPNGGSSMSGNDCKAQGRGESEARCLLFLKPYWLFPGWKRSRVQVRTGSSDDASFACTTGIYKTRGWHIRVQERVIAPFPLTEMTNH